jgi:hypothetical protein
MDNVPRAKRDEEATGEPATTNVLYEIFADRPIDITAVVAIRPTPTVTGRLDNVKVSHFTDRCWLDTIPLTLDDLQLVRLLTIGDFLRLLVLGGLHSNGLPHCCFEMKLQRRVTLRLL